MRSNIPEALTLQIKIRIYVYNSATILTLGVLLLLATGGSVEARNLLWAKQVGGGTGNGGSGIAVDNSANSYVTGYFDGSATFGAGEANQTTLTSASGNDVFVAKYNSSGALQWAKRAGGAGFDEAYGIAVDGSGNSYVTGYFEGSATFGQGQANQTLLTAAGGSDIFVAKYNSSGALQWAKRAGGTVDEAGFGIGVDSSGNSYVTGYFEGSATFGAGQANQTLLTAAGGSDIFVAKYNSSGALQWAKRAGGTVDEAGYGIAVDSSGNSYVTGYFEGSATFGAGQANQTILTAGSDDVFVATYNSSGALQWARRAGGTGFVDGVGIRVDSSGNSYVAGTFSGSATFGAGEANQTTLTAAGSSFDIFVAKYNSSGALQWAKRAGGMSSDEGYSLGVDGSGNSYVTGYFEGSATFGAGEANQTTLTAPGGGFDIFVAKYNSSGALQWARRAGGTDLELGVGIAVDGSGNSYVTGYFAGSATFGAGEAKQTTLTSAGGFETFVAKFSGNTAGDIDILVPGDYDGDGKADQAVYRNGGWFILRSSDGVGQAVGWGGAAQDVPVPADYDGDGKADVAVYRDGAWFILRSSDGGMTFVSWGGLPEDKPMPADYDGDGKADVAVYRDGAWFILRSSEGGVTFVSWGGLAQDIPVPSDYDGDGKADVAVYRDGAWFIMKSSGATQAVGWGGAAQDVPVPADYDGDGKTDIAIYRSGAWFIMKSSGGTQLVSWGGTAQDIPVPADYDGDGKADITIFRDGAWYIIKSGGGTQSLGWGAAGDVPIN